MRATAGIDEGSGRADEPGTLPADFVDRNGGAFRVRRFLPEDRPALAAMYADFEPKRAAQGLPPGDAEGIARWLDRILAEGVHLLVEVAGEVRGHAMLLRIDAERAELANFLHQSVRFRGIGTRLNRIVLALARDGGYRRVWLCVEPGNRPAIRSYERAGFRMVPGQIWAPEVEMVAELETAAPQEAPGASSPAASPEPGR